MVLSTSFWGQKRMFKTNTVIYDLVYELVLKWTSYLRPVPNLLSFRRVYIADIS